MLQKRSVRLASKKKLIKPLLRMPSSSTGIPPGWAKRSLEHFKIEKNRYTMYPVAPNRDRNGRIADGIRTLHGSAQASHRSGASGGLGPTNRSTLRHKPVQRHQARRALAAHRQLRSGAGRRAKETAFDRPQGLAATGDDPGSTKICGVKQQGLPLPDPCF